MKKTYFVSSDIHGFFSIYYKTLKRKGFDINNKNHILVLCGDCWDRGLEAIEMLDFLKSIPKDRRILIRGNHELLFLQMIDRGYPKLHDFSNGTVDTLLALNNYNEKQRAEMYIYLKRFCFDSQYFVVSEESKKLFNLTFSKLVNHKNVKRLIKFIKSKEWVNYFELDKYIFVHAFIPNTNDWRNASQEEWNQAMWACPYKEYLNGNWKENKILVCGHWHTSDFYENLTYKTGKYIDIYKCPIFKDKNYSLIGLDACTALSRRINILVIKK